MKPISWFPLTPSVTLNTSRDELSFSWVSDGMRWHWPSHPLLISEFTAVSCCAGKAERLRDGSCSKNKRGDNTNCRFSLQRLLTPESGREASLHGYCRSKIIGHGPDCVKSDVRKRGFSSPFSILLFLTLVSLSNAYLDVQNFCFYTRWKTSRSQMCPTWLD